MTSYTNVKSLIITNPTLAASIDTMALDIAAAMRKLGVGARVFMSSGEKDNPDLVKNLLEEIRIHPGPSFILDINAKLKIFTESGNFFDEVGIPKFSFMTDNPIHHISNLQKLSKNSLCGMVSLEHIEYSQLFGLNSKKCIFFPHGGPPALVEPRTTQEREIEILFAGNIKGVHSFEEWIEGTFTGEHFLKSILLELHDIIDYPKSRVFSILIKKLSHLSVSEIRHILQKIFCPLERFLIDRERIKVLSATKKHKVTIIGGVTKDVVEALPHHNFLGEKSYTEVMDAMSRSKISLNIVPTFRSGGHERMFYSLAYGSLLLTDQNDYLEKDQLVNPFINFLPVNLNDMDHILAQKLSDTKDLDDLRKIAIDHYSKNHTWEHRIVPVLDMLCEEYSSKICP